MQSNRYALLLFYIKSGSNTYTLLRQFYTTTHYVYLDKVLNELKLFSLYFRTDDVGRSLTIRMTNIHITCKCASSIFV